MREKTTHRFFLVLIIIALVLSSCKPEGEQEFTIISGYEGMAAYVEAVKSDPDADLDDLYQKYVVDPYWKDCASGGEYRTLAKRATANPIKDLNGLSENISAIEDANIEQIIEEALRKSSVKLPGPDTTVCIFAIDPDLSWERMHGVTGFTAGAGKIWIQLSPEKEWLDWIPYTIAHEYHHSVWTHQYFKWFKKFTLLDYLIFEGRADSFAHLIYPDKIAPWTTAISSYQETRQWEKISEDLEITDLEKQRKYMFGDRSDSIPIWTGYTIGFHIVQQFLENHPEMSIEEWTGMNAREIFEASGYEN